MQGHAVFKAKKLLKINLWHDYGLIDRIEIHGDFFMHPEENISKLEDVLSGVVLEKSVLEQTISNFLTTTIAFGFTADDLTNAILQAGGKNP